MKITLGKLQAFLEKTSGATAVEFAFIALPLFFLLAGTIEAARAFWTYTVVNEVAQIGARCAGLPEPSCSNSGALASKSVLVQHIESVALSRGVSLQSLNVEIILDATDCATIGQYVRIDIFSEFNSFIGSFDLRGTACHIRQSHLES